MTGRNRRVRERSWCHRCQKFGYLSRGDAKLAARTFHPGDHLSAYPCPGTACFWHYGHLQNVTLHGQMRRQRRSVS